MFIETNSANSGGEIVFVSFERTEINQYNNITFYWNRFSISKKDQFGIHLMLPNWQLLSKCIND